MTRVSVLVPTYNRQEYLAQALVSLMAQTHPDVEVYVLNDGGEPPFRPARPRCIHYIDLPHRDQAATLNAGLAVASGDYVTVAQDDDLVLPDSLALLSAALDAAPPHVGVVYSLPQYTDERSEPVDTPPQLREYLLAHPVVTWAHIERGHGLLIHGTATLYRRTALVSVGGWDETLTGAEEYDLHLRLLKAGWDFHAVDRVTVTYRRHPGGKSWHQARRREIRRQLARIYERLGLAPEPEATP